MIYVDESKFRDVIFVVIVVELIVGIVGVIDEGVTEVTL